MRLALRLALWGLALAPGAVTLAGDKLKDYEIHCKRPDDYPAPTSDKAVSEKTPGKHGRLALVAYPDEEVPFGWGYRGMRVLLVNRTGERATVLTYDTTVKFLVQEALDEHGRWRQIETEGCFGFCGNALGQLHLGPGRYWELAAPRYTGSFKTRLRFRLWAFCPSREAVYSNEFEGSINPTQFWKAPPR